MKRHNNNSLTMEQFSKILLDEESVLKLLNSENIAALSQAAVFACEIIAKGDYSPLSFLSRAAKKKKIREIAISALKTEHFEAMLNCSNKKHRKNAAKLMGLIGSDEHTELLINALNREQARLCIPSIILALGAIGSQKAHNGLMEYSVKPAADETEIKHEAEEREALKKALATLDCGYKHSFVGFDAINSMQLICANRTAVFVAEELKNQGMNVVSYSDTTVDIAGGNFESIYSVRSFRELLIPLIKSGELGELQSRLLDILDKTHEKSDKPYRFRIEYRGGDNRNQIIKEILTYIDSERLCNSVSDYELELRVYDDKSVKLKLFTYKDNRFDYRKAAISASIHPANAASVISFASRYFTRDATVLDMCCGSGTMLFEREMLLPAKRLIGVDITEKAITAAKQNAEAFDKKFLFYHADCTRFTLREPVDEIISNLPFGSRVGTHENNERLYRDIFNNIMEWLVPGGIALLYTMEYNLVKQQVKGFDELEIIDALKTEAGGLMPVACVIRRMDY